MNTEAQQEIAREAADALFDSRRGSVTRECFRLSFRAAIKKATEHLYKLLDEQGARNWGIVPPAQPQRSELQKAAAELYIAGYWQCHELPTSKQIELWENLRKAIPMPEGIATFHEVGYKGQPRDCGEWQHKIADFVNLILHGDDEHKTWLREAGEAFILGKPIPQVRHRKFSCAYCHKGMESVVSLLRVNKLGDLPAIWICKEHFNYDDWKQAR